jgi:hypothetical protein
MVCKILSFRIIDYLFPEIFIFFFFKLHYI